MQLFLLLLFLFLWLISTLILLWSEKILERISILLNLLMHALCPKMWSVLENVPHVLENSVCFPGCAGLYIRDREWVWSVWWWSELALHSECWAKPLCYCVYYSQVWGRVCSLFAGVAVLGFSSKLQYEAGRIDLLPVEEDPLNAPLQKLSIWKVCSVTL